MKNKVIITFLLFLTISGITSAQNWRNIQSVEDVCNAYPDEMKKMLKRFNLDFPGLEKVKMSVETGNLTEACSQLLAYYQKVKCLAFKKG